MRTPHQECSDRKHIPGGGKSTESSSGSPGAALGAGEQSRELPSLSSTGRAGAAAFPGITQSKDSPKAVPAFQDRTSLRSSFLQPFLQPLEVSQGAAVSQGMKIPQVCGQRPQEPQEPLPGPALGFGQTPCSHQGLSRGDRASAASIPQEATPNPFCFPVPRPGSSLGSCRGCTAQAPQPQQHFHGARDGFGMSKNAKEHKPMDLPVPLSKGSSDIHLGEEPLTPGIPKAWGAL